MAKFKMVEGTYAYREYTIEADNFEDAQRKWENYSKDLEIASNRASWEIAVDDIQLDQIVNEETHEIEYCS